MEQEREKLEVDVAIVGAGPAGLSAALRLGQLAAQAGKEPNVVVLEKGLAVGSHAISGALLDPQGLRELLPDYGQKEPPFEAPVSGDDVYYLTSSGNFKFPFLPAALQNHGNYVISVGKFTRWLSELVEETGVEVFTGFPGAELLYDGGKVIGVRTGDRGLDKHGEKKPNYEPGVDIEAKVTILAEGSRGSLTKSLVSKLGLDSAKHPQMYTTGVKELWQLPEGRFEAGKVIHTLGYPLESGTFGGGFIYGMAENKVAMGFVVDLGYENPFTDPHAIMQQFKKHPLIRPILKEGTILCWGAKTIPEGGYYSIPKLYADGVLIAGDSGGLLDAARIKGIHTAMKSGAVAAETAWGAIEAGSCDEGALAAYQKNLMGGWAGFQLHKVRNFHQAFQGSMAKGFFHYAFQMITGGKGLVDPMSAEENHNRTKRLDQLPAGKREPAKITFDGELTFDKLTAVYHSRTKHEEEQPCHLVISDYDICNNKCTAEYGNPCQYFCPAQVYEMEETDGKKTLKLNPSNCVHCKTCDIADPYQIINWVPPEGGGGPQYVDL
jgi:electron-transferring-flavoprotein dehydrogenase